MSDEQDKSDPKARPRKIARSGSTAERQGPVSDAPPSEGQEAAAAAPVSAGPSPDGPDSRKKWDVRAERPEGAARPRPRRPHGRFESDLAASTRRPGASGGRASPEMPVRGPVDKASPDFVDRWLSRPARKPEDQKPREDRGERGERPRRDGPRGDGPRGDGPRRDGAARPGMRTMRLDAKPAAPPAAPSQPRLPTMHETILVGLPRVAAAQRAADKSANKPKTAKEALAARTQQAPAKPKTEPAKGEVVLDPSWVKAGWDDAVSVLKSAGPAAEALVDAWLSASNVDAIAAAGASEDLSGPARKASRRALGVLKARGVTIPVRAPKEGAVKPGDEEVIEATFSPPDGRGTTSFTIARRKGGERAHIAEVIMREGVGVVNAVSGWMSRSQIKEAHQRITDSTGVQPATVSPEWARYRIAQAKSENAKSGALVPLGLERCKDLVDPTPEAEPTHPVAELEASAEAGDANGGLHAEPEMRSWLPETRALDELLRKVGEKLSAGDNEDSKKVDEILQEEIKSATDRYFTPEQRGLIARRMRDAAISIRQRAGDERAKEVLSAAKAIEAAGLITSPPSELEFLRVFFQKGLSVLAQQQGGLRVPVAQK